MAKIPFDESALIKAINDAMKAAGMSASQAAVKKAVGATTKSAGRRAPKAPLKGAAAAKPARAVPKITPQTAAGGRGGKKPPKPPTASAAAPKSPKPKKPAGGAKKMTRAEKREINVAKHREERSKFLSESSERSRIAKEETRAANRAAWAKRQDEMEARRLAGRKKMNKKKEAK